MKKKLSQSVFALDLVHRQPADARQGPAAIGDGETVSVFLGDRMTEACTLTLDEPLHVGDWVTVHSGFALGRLTDEQARAALDVRRGGTQS